jgi:hypothetical protein
VRKLPAGPATSVASKPSKITDCPFFEFTAWILKHYQGQLKQ